MSTSSAVASVSRSDGHRWFDQRLPELTRRARLFACRLPRGERDEAVSEVLAMVFLYVLNADARGKLNVLTVPSLVRFYFRAFLDGRRAAGASGRDVFSRRAQRRHGVRVVSLDQPRRIRTRHGEAILPLSEVLADRRSDRPLENARRNLDYPEILDHAGANRQVKRVFEFFCETAGAGKQVKDELGDILAAYGYEPPAARKPEKRSKKRGRPAGRVPRYLHGIPLNPGTTPARRRHDEPEDCRTPRLCPARRLPILLRNVVEIPQRKAATNRESIKAERRKDAQTTGCQARPTR